MSVTIHDLFIDIPMYLQGGPGTISLAVALGNARHEPLDYLRVT